MRKRMGVKQAPRIKSAPWCQSIQEVKAVPPAPEASAEEVNAQAHGS